MHSILKNGLANWRKAQSTIIFISLVRLHKKITIDTLTEVNHEMITVAVIFVGKRNSKNVYKMAGDRTN